MKTFSVAVAVAVVLAFICTQESSALPVTGRLLNIRKKRASMKCTPYCYPTGDGIFCGVRCDF